jgi:hypothetical protein
LGRELARYAHGDSIGDVRDGEIDAGDLVQIATQKGHRSHSEADDPPGPRVACRVVGRDRRTGQDELPRRPAIRGSFADRLEFRRPPNDTPAAATSAGALGLAATFRPARPAPPTPSPPGVS